MTPEIANLQMRAIIRAQVFLFSDHFYLQIALLRQLPASHFDVFSLMANTGGVQ